MNHTATSRTSWFALLKSAFSDWSEDKALRLSAALAYYSTFSIAPLLVITIGIAGLVLGQDAVNGQLQEQMKHYVGGKAAEALQTMVESASKPAHGIVATVIGFVTLMLGASGVFGELKDALNTIWEVKAKAHQGVSGMIRARFLNFGMVLVIGFLLLVSLVMSTAITGLNHMLENVLPIPAVVWGVLAALISLALVTTLFALIFKVLPDVKIEWRDVWMGAAITAVLFEVGKTGLSWYLGRESTANAYGAAGSVVLLLLWVYYTSCILFFGAEFTQVYAQARGRRIEPSAHAEPVTADARAQQGLETSSGATTQRAPHPHATAPYAATPPLPHKLMGPLLKYLEARGVLLSLEAKEALKQSLGLIIGAAVACVATFAAWLLLVTALVGFLTHYLDWSWVAIVAATGGLHVLLILGIGLWIIMKLKRTTWFAHTVQELKHDRQWLQGKTVNA